MHTDPMLIEHEAESAKRSKLDVFSFIALQVLLFLTPIFFVPFISVPFQTGKNAFFIYGIIAIFLLWLVARLKDGSFLFPKSLFYASSALLAVAYSLAAIFSPSHLASFAGQGFELGTLAFFVPSLVLFALVPLIVTSKERIFYSYATLLSSFLLVGLFHIARFVFGSDFLSFDMLSSASSNLIGKWNDVGIFFGLATLVSVVTLEKVKLSRLLKVLVNICLVVSIAMLVVVNFSLLWVSLAVFSLVFFVYELSVGRREEGKGTRKGVSLYALSVFAISLFFVIAGPKVGGIITDSLGLSQAEIRPALSTTVQVTGDSLSRNPFFGVGPNRFFAGWLLDRPEGVNQSQYWNVDFNYGFGFIPSFGVTTGLVGLVAVIAFVALFILSTLRALLRPASSPFSRYLVVSSCVGAAYLWTMSLVYVPSPAIWVLTLFVSGLFVASLREDGVVGTLSIKTVEKPVANFMSVLFVIFAIISTLAFAYFVTTRLIASIHFQKAALAINVDGDADEAEGHLAKALSVAPSDVQARALSELYLMRIQSLLNDDKLSETEVQTLFQKYLSTSIQAANEAVALDGTNYVNYVSQGQVFEAIITLKIEGAYEEAKKAYESALVLNPGNPELNLALARIEVAKGDNKAARVELGKALEKKGDYTPAVYLLAQMQVAERNVPEAIRSIEAIAMLSPNDSGVFLQLGLLYYDQKQYANAVLAFGRAVEIDPQYANAKYLLGLSYYQTKEPEKALQQFKELLVTNPDNAEVKEIIANLEAGKAPVTIPKGQLPEPPVKESSVSENI